MGLTVIVSIATGCVIGRICTSLFKNKINLLRNVLCGMFGGLLGGLSVYYVNLSVNAWIAEIALSAIGAFVFVWIIKITDKNRG